MTEPSAWRPTRRRLTDSLFSALVPVAACSVALAALTTWTGAGKAGGPPRIAVSNGRVILPYEGIGDTDAFFDIANPGGSDDRLVRVTSTAARGAIALGSVGAAGEHGNHGGAAETAVVPAGRGISVSLDGLDAALRGDADRRTGDRVPFTLHFEHSGAVRTVAVVNRPGS
ncbi:copper chaperone PCu(A)C [Streptomyces sp. F63]|uniref:copper chaperone PCu(A)C n=1 Tax=Streptomyces sp. F63 TaxID=2824887 RepID=UPI001B392CC6|nr:copper chaperone PCu(A)C [Streptomyces sp. F63]MBQ0987487.1 copper chaperone PCu(A)C [Streptomyces sp. F63]